MIRRHPWWVAWLTMTLILFIVWNNFTALYAGYSPYFNCLLAIIVTTIPTLYIWGVVRLVGGKTVHVKKL